MYKFVILLWAISSVAYSKPSDVLKLFKAQAATAGMSAEGYYHDAVNKKNITILTAIRDAATLAPDIAFFQAAIDAANATVSPGTIDHNSLLNYVANEHIDWANATENFLTTGSVGAGTLSIGADGPGVLSVFQNLSPSVNANQVSMRNSASRQWNYRVPNIVGSSQTWVMPSNNTTAGYVLSTTTGGTFANLEWVESIDWTAATDKLFDLTNTTTSIPMYITETNTGKTAPALRIDTYGRGMLVDSLSTTYGGSAFFLRKAGNGQALYVESTSTTGGDDFVNAARFKSVASGGATVFVDSETENSKGAVSIVNRAANGTDGIGIRITVDDTTNGIPIKTHSSNWIFQGVREDVTDRFFRLGMANMTSNYNWQLPANQGGAGEFLTNDGSGNLDWAAAGGGGGVADLQGAYDGGKIIAVGDGGADYIQLNSSASSAGETIRVTNAGTSGSAGALRITSNNGTALRISATTGIPVLAESNSTRPTFQSTNLSNRLHFRLTDEIGNNPIDIGTAAGQTTHTLRLPPSQGNLGTVLRNDGAGNLSWENKTLMSKVTADPCGDTVNYPEATQFYNDTSDYMCFCNGANADVQVHAPANACF